MKIKGKVITGPNSEVIVIPRPSGEDIIFKAEAVLDFTDFHAVCPEPVPPQILRRGSSGYVEDIENPEYREKLSEHAQQRFRWMVLKSLEATPDLEWETVKIGDPTTWGLYETELKKAGFSQMEIGRIIRGVMSANCLDENLIKQARERFLVSQREQQGT